MTTQLDELFERNRRWAEATEQRSPGFFTRLLAQQAPQYLWIGCADSRVPANELVDLLPGELFVHRNVANVVAHCDLNCLSVIQFATDVLQVQHIIVVGHSRCGGVRAALQGRRVGLADNWLRHVQDVRNRHSDWLATVDRGAARGRARRAQRASSRRSTSARPRSCATPGRAARSWSCTAGSTACTTACCNDLQHHRAEPACEDVSQARDTNRGACAAR